MILPDGKTEKLTDTWNDDDQEDHIIAGMWRGTTTFFAKVPPKPDSTSVKSGDHSPVYKTDVKATDDRKPASKGKVRQLVEICSLTLMMTAAALASSTTNWNAMTPISIEQGFDLLTEMGRRNAEQYIRQEKPDLIVAEWMCDPYSQKQNIYFAKGGLTEAKILDMRKSNAKLVDWIAKQERWQR